MNDQDGENHLAVKLKSLNSPGTCIILATYMYAN